MWVATKSFRYRGVRYNVGDQVPAETWPNRRALTTMRRIRLIPDSVEEVSPVAVKPIADMKRTELNEYATTQGILDAAIYANREALLAELNRRAALLETVDAEEVELPPGVEEEDDFFGSDEAS